MDQPEDYPDAAIPSTHGTKAKLRPGSILPSVLPPDDRAGHISETSKGAGHSTLTLTAGMADDGIPWQMAVQVPRLWTSHRVYLAVDKMTNYHDSVLAFLKELLQCTFAGNTAYGMGFAEGNLKQLFRVFVTCDGYVHQAFPAAARGRPFSVMPKVTWA